MTPADVWIYQETKRVVRRGHRRTWPRFRAYGKKVA